MKRTWIYVLVVALLVVVAYLFRERYENYEAALKDVGQTAGYTDLKAPAATTNTGVDGATTPATGSSPGTSGTTASGATTGNTTGGTTTTPEPTSGGNAASSSADVSGDSQTVAGVPGNNVFGPPFVGVGANGDGSGRLGPVPYPYLYGPKPDSSTMVPGAGIANPSQAATLFDSGVLPSVSVTGSDKNSHLFGASRVPGDKDIIQDPYGKNIPNPYATNTAFSLSSGSSKTEPLPYLTDFSAFAK